MKIEACAKINLTLEVLGRRVDGYHALRSIVQPISLADELDIVITDNDKIVVDTGYGEDDLIVKAARSLGCHTGLSVHVDKKIPVGGGLGGGSADAAATLRALNELWSLGKSPEELATIGAEVGSDVPALVLAQHYKHAVLMEGRGEVVSLANPSLVGRTSDCLVLANPGINSSTPAVFAAFGKSCYPNPKNDLQNPAISLYPAIGATLECMEQSGAKDVLMSGSGATVFGFAPNEKVANEIVSKMKKNGYFAWNVRAF